MELTESQLFESPAVSLGVHEVDEDGLEREPATVNCQELPADLIHGKRVNVGREETTELAPDLFDADSTAALGVREEFDEIGCRLLAKAIPKERRTVQEDVGESRKSTYCM